MVTNDFERKIIEVAKPYFEFCRSGDWKHAERVVNWVKELGEGRKDLDVIITAAYLHDVGWYKVLPKGKIDLDEMLRHEIEANRNSSRYVQEVLDRLDYSESDVKKVLRLVGAADDHEASLEDEEIIVDADNLSKLCVEHLREKYQKESYKKLIKLWEDELADQIRTPRGRAIYPGLLADLKRTVLG
ncbi:MAG: HD domain-containing protein [Minisyncoccia bacterium]|jgi:hypothetical protein